jgi:nicotinamide mononucleotide adenylyltransferase
MKSFKTFITEAKGDMLDVSIKSIEKVFNDSNKIQKLLDTKVEVTEKYDGTKLTLVRNDKPWSSNYADNWIVAFKGNILYPEEYVAAPTAKIKKSSIGMSQYKLVFEHLKKNHSNTKDIPTNTEFFIEYIMDKPTLTRDYQVKHGMILLAYSPTKYTEKNGRLKTVSPKFITNNLPKISKSLKIPTPRVIHVGKLGDLAKGSFSTPESHLAEVRRTLLNLKSEFGGKTEGSVIKMPNGELYKFLQDDQHDKEVRQAKKARYQMDRGKESNYWDEIRNFLKPIIDEIKVGDLKFALKELSNKIYKLKSIPISHEKKELINIQDDLMLTGKNILMRKLKGNNNAMFSGRFSPPTKAHIKIVEDAMKKYDGVVLNIVKTKKPDEKNPFPLDLQIKMWKSVFPKLKIQTSETGNLITIIRKSDENINVILAGTDRVRDYENQLKTNPDVSVEEIKRTADDISATKVRNALKSDDMVTFKANMDSRLYKFYDELKKHVL